MSSYAGCFDSCCGTHVRRSPSSKSSNAAPFVAEEVVETEEVDPMHHYSHVYTGVYRPDGLKQSTSMDA